MTRIVLIKQTNKKNKNKTQMVWYQTCATHNLSQSKARGGVVIPFWSDQSGLNYKWTVII